MNEAIVSFIPCSPQQLYHLLLDKLEDSYMVVRWHWEVVA